MLKMENSSTICAPVVFRSGKRRKRPRPISLFIGSTSPPVLSNSDTTHFIGDYGLNTPLGAVSYAPREEFTAKVTALLSSVYQFCDEGKSEQALDIIYEYVDDLIDARRFDETDELLRTVDVARIDAATMIGFLSSTFLVKSHLTTRGTYSQAVRECLRATRASKDVDDLLRTVG